MLVFARVWCGMLVPGLWNVSVLHRAWCGKPVPSLWKACVCEGLVWNARVWVLRGFVVEFSCMGCGMLGLAEVWCAMLACGLWHARVFRGLGVEGLCLGCGMLAFERVWCGMLVPGLWNVSVLRRFGVEC